MTEIFGSCIKITQQHNSKYLQHILENVFVRKNKWSYFVYLDKEPWFADRCAAEVYFCSIEVITYKKIKLDDESQLSLMMTKIIEITFWVGCICKKAGENKYSATPSDVFLRSGSGAERQPTGQDTTQLMCRVRARINEASLLETRFPHKKGITAICSPWSQLSTARQCL